MSFIKNVEIMDGKADTIYSALSNKCEKCGEIGFGRDEASIMIQHKKIALKLKWKNLKILSIHCHNYRLALAILPFFKESTFLRKKKILLFNMLVFFIVLILIIS